MKLPQPSIATKLYAIFALLATVTAGLASIAVISAHRHAALTEDFESAYAAAIDVERVNGLIYAVVMETRGVSLAQDVFDARHRATSLLKLVDRISDVMKDWQRNARAGDAGRFREFSGRVQVFQNFHRELIRRVTDEGLPAAREWAGFAESGSVHTVLSDDLAALAKGYSDHAAQIYADLDRNIAATAWLMSILGALAILLAAAGAYTIWRAVARPLARITRVTEAVAAGELQAAVPYAKRGDEVGALARSIAVFQEAMRRNEEFNRAALDQAEARKVRREQMSAEISQFSAEVETTLIELGRISDQMLSASTQLSSAADQAAARTAGATSASAEASDNVRDIASAADELAASVQEIDRQVAHSNDVAVKAVDEAERTNAAVKELDEAAGRIGDVIRLITDIAEQTNLLALNATIEAARAGEAGRGFAVVASEVKALAGQTAKATDEVAAQIAGMQHATRRSIEAIGAIELIIREMGEISSTIAAAVTEQGAATHEIARSVDIAAKRTVDTTEEVKRVSAATTDTRASAAAVKDVSADLGMIAGDIRIQVEQFFVRLRAISPTLAACHTPISDAPASHPPASKAAGM